MGGSITISGNQTVGHVRVNQTGAVPNVIEITNAIWCIVVRS